MQKSISKSHTLLKEWRTIELSVPTGSECFPNDILKLFALVDEYCTYAFTDCLLEIISDLGRSECRSCQETVSEALINFEEMFMSEQQHGDDRDYQWVQPEHTPERQEEVLHRRRSLKRQMWSVLYLDSRRRDRSAFKRHMGPMIAAAAAAVWAGFANIMILQYMTQGQGFFRDSELYLGN